MLLILGFGTKAGLAPLHAWLPDAHSQAPAPVSALMSGVLLVGRVLRHPARQGHRRRRRWARFRPHPAGRDRARLARGRRDPADRAARLQTDAGLLQHRAHGPARAGRRHRQPLAIAAVLLHILGHGLAKSALFLQRRADPAGHRHQPDRRRSAAWPPAHPVLAGCFGARRARADRVPPVQPVRQRTGHRPRRFRRAASAGLTAAAFVLVLVIAAALVGHTSRMLLGPPPDTSSPTAPDPTDLARPPRPAPIDGEHRRDAGGRARGVVRPSGSARRPLDHLLHLAADVLTGTP